MSNNNQRPWYRTAIIIIPAIAVIIAAIIGGIFVLMSSPQTPTTPIFIETIGEIDTDGSYEISWERSIRATHYILQEDRDFSFTNPRTIDTNTETKGQIFGRPNGDYYYRVRAYNDAGESEWSPSRRVTVEISTTNGSSQTPTPTITPAPTQIIVTPTPTPTATPTQTPIQPTPTATQTPTPITYLKIQKFNDTNRNATIDSNDARLSGWEFNVTDPEGKTTTCVTDDMGEIIIIIPGEYEENDYTIEEILKPGWNLVHPIKQTVEVSKGKTSTVQFLNQLAESATPTPPPPTPPPPTPPPPTPPPSIILTYNDFKLEEVCTYENNWCGDASIEGKAVVYGSMTTDINVPEGASELKVTISICCNGRGEGLKGPAGSAAYIRVGGEIREEKIDSTMPLHNREYYRYESCENFSNTFDVRGEVITLVIEMSGGALLDFYQAELTFS